MRNIFTRFDATSNHNPGATRMVGKDASPRVKGARYHAPSYEPNTEEDMVDAMLIVNEMILDKELRFHADNP